MVAAAAVDFVYYAHLIYEPCWNPRRSGRTAERKSTAVEENGEKSARGVKVSAPR